MNSRSTILRAARQFWLAWACGGVLALLTVVMALGEHLPVRDPDDDLLPSYVRMPAIVLAAIALDVLPRVGSRLRARRTFSAAAGRSVLREVLDERWRAEQWWFAVNGMAAWYLCYAAFRNVKNMAPFVNPHQWDAALREVDRFLFGGHDPAAVLHAWLGTGIAAHLLSGVYIAWIGLVPVTIAVALVWTRHTRAGSWYVTAVAVDWVAGALIYVLVPTVGPIYSSPALFADLPTTYVSDLEAVMWADRAAVLADPWGTASLQSIAAFASLHVGIMVTICLCARLFGLPAWLQSAAWVFLALTVVATIYLGWHFAVDTVGGALLGAFAVWVAGLATGNRDGWRVRLVSRDETPTPAAASAAPAGASDGRP